MTKLNDLARLGQSIWLDYIQRDMLVTEELAQLLDMGVRGVTSNPSIFQQAISESDAYDDSLRQLALEGKTPLEIYEALAVDDIQRAADLFRSLYNQTDGEDGYVSLEVNPELANDTELTIAEARRLFALVDRPNVYIKVPASPAGIPAIEQLIGEGINVNVTLIFSRELYDQVIEAYLRGLETLIARGGDPRDVSSVASFFVSRVDSNVDARLDALGVQDIRGKAGIANARLAYQLFRERFAGERWEGLAARGARLQRPLWASTSTKDPAYPDTMYVDELIGPHTVNTVPPHTLEAVLDHGRVETTLTEGLDEARTVMARLEELGISIETVTAELLEEGIAKFAQPFRKLIAAIAAERADILRDVESWAGDLGQYGMAVQVAARKLADDDVLRRLWAHDHTLWSESPDEITNRLGWLTIARSMAGVTDELQAFAADVRRDGYEKVVLLGMGGSSLAPELFARTFGPAPGHPELLVLDSTDPLAVNNVRKQLDPHRTLFIVSSKSGGTVETLSLFNYFYSWAKEELEGQGVGEHFVAISDPGSRLMELASRYQFRAAFANDPNIGGRYSALSYFGLVPAALLGIDLDELLARAQRIDGPEAAQKAGWLGVALGTLAEDGRDRVSFITTPSLAGFGDWVEQLIAESTGKQGRGILPIVGEPPLEASAYSRRQLIVYLRLLGEENYDEQLAEFAGEPPVIALTLQDRYDIAEQFLVWEIATAVAGHILGVNPFNQPNVESAKLQAQAVLDSAADQELTMPLLSFSDGPVKVYEAHLPADNAARALDNFLQLAHADSYIAVQAYTAPTAENDAALVRLRNYLRRKAGVPVTVGYGPRFLHSTGQLHKGDAGDGLFIQMTTEAVPDLPIPDEPGEPASSVTFGTLKMAQALGDAAALKEAGRPVIRFHSASNSLPPLVAAVQR